MAVRKGKKAPNRMTPLGIERALKRRIRELESEVNVLRTTEGHWDSLQAAQAQTRANTAHGGHADARTATECRKADHRATPASEIALNDLQGALRDLGSEVIQLRNELELVLQPAGPRGVADSNLAPEPPRSPLTRRIRDMIGDANGTAEMVRDLRDRLEIGAQESPF